MLARALHLAGPVEAAMEEARRSVDAFEQVLERTDAPEATRGQLVSALLSLDQGAASRASLATRTIELLAEAVDAGFDNLTEIQSTAALDPLRDDPRFQAIVDRMTSAAQGE